MIDYRNLADSLDFYERIGFKRIESPWTVSKAIASLTAPKGATLFEIEHNQKALVASGEQSFLYLYLKGFLPKGKFQTVTPCFRDDLFDITHTKYFIKNELIETEDVNFHKLDFVIATALSFFKSKFPEELRENVKIVDIDKNQYDIVYKNKDQDQEEIELGSYGIRECDFLSWIYGTGCAEPRLSNCLRKVN